MIIDTTNLLIPLGQFMDLFNLTKEELRAEGASERLQVFGQPVPEGWDNLAVFEEVARAWVQNKRVPKKVRMKVRKAGGLAALERWREAFFEQEPVPVKNTLVLPDGTNVGKQWQLRKPLH